MFENWKTTELIEHVLLSATTMTDEQAAVVERFDDLLDAAFGLETYLKNDPSPDHAAEAYRDFAHYVIDNFLHG